MYDKIRKKKKVGKVGDQVPSISRNNINYCRSFNMDFKVGDIVEFSNEYENFREFMYGRKQVITHIDAEGIWTMGHGWSYRDFDSPHNQLRTRRDNLRFVIKLTPPKSWEQSKLKFLFINSDLVDSSK